MSLSRAIFISYRRSDSIAEAGRIYDKFAEAFGTERIFKDVDNIPYGADFVAYLEESVAKCDVFIPLIGPDWLTAADSNGNRRLDDPHDFVRIEIASALNRGILVLPILLDGAKMPDSVDLPDDLKSLTRRNAALVRHDPDFHSDMRRLIAKLNEYFDSDSIEADSITHTPSAIDQPAKPTSNRTHPKDANLIGKLLSGITGLNGLLALIDGVTAGIHSSIIVGVLLIAAAALLLTRQLWAWGFAIAAQIITLILCSQEIYYVLEEGE